MRNLLPSIYIILHYTTWRNIPNFIVLALGCFFFQVIKVWKVTLKRYNHSIDKDLIYYHSCKCGLAFVITQYILLDG